MMGNGCIIVEPGGKLIINGGKLSNAEIMLKMNSSLYIKNGGIVETRNGFKAQVGAKVIVEDGKIE